MSSHIPPAGLPQYNPQYGQEHFQRPVGPLSSYQAPQTTGSPDQSGIWRADQASGVTYSSEPSPLLPPRPDHSAGYGAYTHSGSYPDNYNQHVSNANLASRAPPASGVKQGVSLQASSSSVNTSTQSWDTSTPQVPAGASYPQNAEDEEILSQAMLFAQTAASPPYAAGPPLSKPVAVPHLTQSNLMTYTQPPGSSVNKYARMYSPVLAPHGVSEVDFMAFLDGLNLVSTTSQAIQAANITNVLLAFDPTGISQTVSLAATVGLQAGQQKVFNRRAAAFLRRANAEFFHPRGLHAAQRSLDELREIAHILSDAPLTTPINSGCILDGVAENRVRAMQPWLAPMKFDVPPEPAPPANNGLQKINNLQKKHLHKFLDRKTISVRLQELSDNPQVLSIDDIIRIAADVRATEDKDLTSKVDKWEKKMLKVAGSGKGRPVKDKGKERREEKATLRSHWLVVTTWDGLEESS